MRFEIGDVVRLSKDSRWYGYDENDPVDVDGIVVALIGTRFPIKVRWRHDGSCVYNETDLKLVKKGENNGN